MPDSAPAPVWGLRVIYREMVFELRHGRPATSLFHALSADPSARARMQSVSLGRDHVTDLIDYAGAPESVQRVRDVLLSPEPTAVLVDSLIDEARHVRFVGTWKRPASPEQGVSLEHILYDTVGPGGLMFGRVEGGVISYKVAAPDGRHLHGFLDAAQAAFGSRWRVVPLRTGYFRPGWEIEDAPASVEPEDSALLSAALAAGYYDEPKRCGVRELGDALGLSKSAIARRLRVLERRALERLVS